MNNNDKTVKVAGRSLVDQLTRLEKTAKSKETDNVVQLPLWPEPARGAPNAMLRSALFAAIDGSKKRVPMERVLIASQKGIEIRFTGLQLSQKDFDVFEQALHIAREHPLGNRCDFSMHSFLKALGMTTGHANHEALKRSFARLGLKPTFVSPGAIKIKAISLYRDTKEILTGSFFCIKVLLLTSNQFEV